MDNGSQPPAKAPRKSHFALIAGVLAILFVLYLMGAFGHKSSRSSNVGAGASLSTSTGAGAAPSAPAAAGGNPILGRWTLVDTALAAYCQSSQEFTPDSGTQVLGGKTSTGRLIYNVKATSVDVSYGGPNTEEWDVNGPDDLTLRLINPYGETSCRYHRS